MGITNEVAGWASELGYEDVPVRVHDRAKAQILSVLGAVHASRHSEAAGAATQVMRSHGGPEECVVYATGERLPRLAAVFANACASVAFDFDDYLFCGHTGHSSVCAALAYGEVVGASGRDVLAAVTAANEAGGRLGAAFLFGPHNGQMWAYIHQLEGALVAARLLGLDADRTADAIGLALAQPVYPLLPAFMGPDSKLLIPSSTSVEGCRAAELAAAGWRGSHQILEDHQGMLRKFNPDALGFMFTGFGEAWISDSLTYKIVPGCAYIDTAVDAFHEVLAAAEADRGTRPAPGDVARVAVRCGLFTAGMEGFSHAYRDPKRLAPITVNFSVALSLGLILAAGELSCEHLSHAWLDEHRQEVEEAAGLVRMEHDQEMDRRAAAASESGGFSLRALLSGAAGTGEMAALAERLQDLAPEQDDATPVHKALAGRSFEGYVMAFPAEVTLRTHDGGSWTAVQDVPLGAAGRPWEETAELVRRKFLDHFSGDRARAAEAVEVVERLEEVDDIRKVTSALAPGA